MESSKEAEAEVALVEKAYLYLTEKSYPADSTKNDKRSIRRKAERLVVKDGVLHYKKDGNNVRFVVDTTERVKILEACHKDPTSGHMGTKRTLARITERFIWPGVAKDVNRLIETCDICQRTGRKISKAAPELHPVPVVSPWHHLGIDFIGPLTPSTHGCQYILTVSDYFSKFVQAFPMESKHASGVADALFKLFLKFGLPKVITSDQGREFNNALDSELMELMGIDHRLTTPYHPQANGLDERFNQTQLFMQGHRKWPCHLCLICSIKTFQQSSAQAKEATIQQSSAQARKTFQQSSVQAKEATIQQSSAQVKEAIIQQSSAKTTPSTSQAKAERQLMFRKRQILPLDSIDVESYTPKTAQKASKMWIQNDLFTLTKEDKANLYSQTSWLTDPIVNAAQKLLKRKVPMSNGFQDVCYGRTYAFDVESSEFVQVLHNGHDHWLTISTQEAEVIVYDSLYPSVSSCVKRQIAALLATQAHGRADAIRNI